MMEIVCGIMNMKIYWHRMLKAGIDIGSNVGFEDNDTINRIFKTCESRKEWKLDTAKSLVLALLKMFTVYFSVCACIRASWYAFRGHIAM